MRSEYIANRRRLMDLIESTPYFTRRSLVQEFRKGFPGDDPLLIDPVMTIPDFLEQWREVGRLGYDTGIYYNRDRAA